MKKSLSIIPIVLCLTGCSDKSAPQTKTPPPVPVQTASVEVRDVPLLIEAMGVVKPSQVADVTAQVQGLIQEIHFTEGEWVERGELLYTLDNLPYAIRVLELKAQQAQDLAHLDNAKKKLERYQKLTRHDLIAQVEVDGFKTQVALYDAMVQADSARLASAELDVQRCQIRAPIAGYAGKSTLHAGNIAHISTSLVTLTRTEPLCVDFSVTEKELLQFHTSSAPIEVYGVGSVAPAHQGKVTFMDHALDPESGMLSLRATLNSPDASLLPGQSVRVHLHVGKKENALLVPLRAVKTNQDGPYLFIVKEDLSVEMRQVTLGPEEKGQIIIESGLEDLSRVVTEGHDRLFPGSHIEEVRS